MIPLRSVATEGYHTAYNVLPDTVIEMLVGAPLGTGEEILLEF